MKTILVVDDEPDFLKVVQVRLESQGYRVVTATNGVEALEQVKENPDLIILDVMMPVMSGYEVCGELRDDPNYNNTPILLLTARNQEIDKRIGKSMNIDYMQKPYQNEAFLAKVEQLLQSR